MSFDGGGSWQQTVLPVQDGGAVPCFSPDVAFGSDGVLYVAFTSFGPVEGRGTVPDALWVTSSQDGGLTLSPPRRARGPSPFQVRLAADPQQPGRLYLTWLEGGPTSTWGFADAGHPISAARSDDGGVSWTDPTRVSPASRAQVVAPVIAVGPGALFIGYLDLGDDPLDYVGAHEGKGGDPDSGPWSLVVARSDDGGGSWREVVVDAGLAPVQRFLILFPPAPSLAIDPLDPQRLYLGFHDARTGDADVYVWGSEDGGKTWSDPTRVVDRPVRDGRSQYLPALSVSPKGRVDVVYYDRRGDASNVRNEVSLQSSDDHGQSFESRVRLSSRSFESTIGFGGERGMAELGSRLGLISTAQGALAVWADTRAGSSLTQRQDLARAVVAFPVAPAANAALRAGAVALGALALGSLAWAWFKR